jgi:hypothetical protein
MPFASPVQKKSAITLSLQALGAAALRLADRYDRARRREAAEDSASIRYAYATTERFDQALSAGALCLALRHGPPRART